MGFAFGYPGVGVRGGPRMREGITLSAGERGRLEAVVADRNSPQKHVWRARIVLLAADGLGTRGIMRQSGKSRNAVNRWRERFEAEGIDGLMRTRPGPRASRRCQRRCA